MVTVQPTAGLVPPFSVSAGVTLVLSDRASSCSAGRFRDPAATWIWSVSLTTPCVSGVLPTRRKHNTKSPLFSVSFWTLAPTPRAAPFFQISIISQPVRLSLRDEFASPSKAVSPLLGKSWGLLGKSWGLTSSQPHSPFSVSPHACWGTLCPGYSSIKVNLGILVIPQSFAVPDAKVHHATWRHQHWDMVARCDRQCVPSHSRHIHSTKKCYL